MPAFDWSDPQSYMNLGMMVLIAIVIMAVGNMVGRLVHRMVVRAARKAKLTEALARFVGQLARYVVLAFAAISALEYVGVDVMGLVALLGAAGLAVGLALQGNLANFASGVMILIFQPFGLDDVITAGGHTGVVVNIGIFATTLRNPENHTIIVPNSAVTSGSIVNFTLMGFQRVNIPVGVAYGSDVDKVVEILTEAVSALDIVRADPAVGVAFVGMGASALDFAVLYFADNADRIASMHEVRRACYNALNENNIDIPFDQMVIHRAPEEA